MFPDLPSDRRLTKAEQSQLADLERRLAASDPALIATFRAGRSAGMRLPRAALATYAVVAGVLLAAAAIVGGVGGAVAVAVSLALTVLVLVVPKHRRRRPAGAPPQAKKTAS